MIVNVPAGVLEAGFTVVVFGALIAFYLHLEKIKGDVGKQVQKASDEWSTKLEQHVKESDSQLERLAKAVNDFTVQVVQRLTAIETTLKERKEKSSI